MRKLLLCVALLLGMTTEAKAEYFAPSYVFESVLQLGFFPTAEMETDGYRIAIYTKADAYILILYTKDTACFAGSGAIWFNKDEDI